MSPSPCSSSLEDDFPADRDEDDVDEKGAGFELLVDECLERATGLGSHAHLAALVEEVVRAAEGDEHPNATSLPHGAEVAVERLERFRNRIVARRLIEWRRFGRCRCGRAGRSRSGRSGCAILLGRSALASPCGQRQAHNEDRQAA